MALSDGRRIISRKSIDLNILRKYRLALKVTEQVYGKDQVDGRIYDGSSPSKVVGTEITRIGSLDRKEYDKKGVAAGFQLYMMVVNGEGSDTGLPSYQDGRSGRKELIDLNNYDLGNIEALLESLPQGTKIMFVWQLDIDRTNDVDLEKSVVRKVAGRLEWKIPDPKLHSVLKPPEPVGDGGDMSGDVDLPDTSVDITRDAGQEKQLVSISDTFLFKGTAEDPVDLGGIARTLSQSVRSFDGSPITLNDLQNVLFMVPKGREQRFDAPGQIRFENEVNVALLEVISSRQLQKYHDASADTPKTDYFSAEGILKERAHVNAGSQSRPVLRKEPEFLENVSLLRKLIKSEVGEKAIPSRPYSEKIETRSTFPNRIFSTQAKVLKEKLRPAKPSKIARNIPDQTEPGHKTDSSPRKHILGKKAGPTKEKAKKKNKGTLIGPRPKKRRRRKIPAMLRKSLKSRKMNAKKPIRIKPREFAKKKDHHELMDKKEEKKKKIKRSRNKPDPKRTGFKPKTTERKMRADARGRPEKRKAREKITEKPRQTARSSAQGKLKKGLLKSREENARAAARKRMIREKTKRRAVKELIPLFRQRNGAGSSMRMRSA